MHQRASTLIAVGSSVVALVVVAWLLASGGPSAPERDLTPAVALLAGSVVAAALVRWLGRITQGLVLVGVAALLAGNWTTVGDENHAAVYRIEAGLDRPSLDELADGSPNRGIADNLGVIFDLGTALGTAQLVVPDEGLASRIRAFTQVDARSGDVSAGAPEVAGGRILGMFGDREVVLVGQGAAARYVWRSEGEGPILVVPEVEP